MVYWFADYPDEPARFIYTADQYQRDRSALTNIAAEITSATDFPKTDDTALCKFFPYRSYCNRGITAGDAADMETESEAEELFDINFEQIGEIAF